MIIFWIAFIQFQPQGKILKTEQVRPQRRLLGGESAVWIVIIVIMALQAESRRLSKILEKKRK